MYDDLLPLLPVICWSIPFAIHFWSLDNRPVRNRKSTQKIGSIPEATMAFSVYFVDLKVAKLDDEMARFSSSDE